MKHSKKKTFKFCIPKDTSEYFPSIMLWRKH